MAWGRAARASLTLTLALGLLGWPQPAAAEGEAPAAAAAPTPAPAPVIPPPPPAASPTKKEDKPRQTARRVGTGPARPAAAAAAPRRRGRTRPASTEPPARVISLVNLWTNEVLPVVGEQLPSSRSVDRFLRCHFTGHATRIDARLLKLAVKAAHRFKSDRVEIISAFRHPKYNLMLRKKGREVAGGSNHIAGKALDFRIPGTPTQVLRAYVLKAGLGGVGFYPRSRFVHIDVGKRRTWKGK